MPSSHFRGLLTALRLQVLDRWPQSASSPLLWQRLGVAEAFHIRWESHQLPSDIAKWYDRIERVDATPPATWLYRQRCRHDLRHFVPAERFANVGRGARHKNSFQVALAVNSYLDEAPATAMPWNGDDDPVVAVPIDRLFDGIGPATLAMHATQAREIVSSWGVGAKGIISVRDPQHPTHRVFNVIAQDSTSGGVRFVDYSAVDHDSAQADHQAEGAAARHLAAIDEHTGFTSIRLWRTSDLPRYRKVSPGTLRGSQQAARAEIERHLPVDMPASARREAADRIWFVRDHTYARWLFAQINRGACTFDPSHLDQLAHRPADLVPLTRRDSVLQQLALRSSTRVVGPTIEFTMIDSDDSELLAEVVAELGPVGSRRDSLVVRHSRIDGFDAEIAGIAVGQRTLDRIGDDNATYAPPLPLPAAPSSTPPLRRSSWLDANQPWQVPHGSPVAAALSARKTNCWNTAAAVANYLSTGAPSTSLPIYFAAPLRPTIPEYLTMLGITEAPTFVSGSEQANAVAAAWGPNTHGIVLAAWSSISTHAFNVVVEESGVRYLDGQTAEDGDFNFHVHWERMSIVKVGDLHETLRPQLPQEDVTDLTQGDLPMGDLPKGVVADLRVSLA